MTNSLYGSWYANVFVQITQLFYLDKRPVFSFISPGLRKLTYLYAGVN